MGDVVQFKVIEHAKVEQHNRELKAVVDRLAQLEVEQQHIFSESMPLIQEYAQLMEAGDNLKVLELLYPQEEFEFVYD